MKIRMMRLIMNWHQLPMMNDLFVPGNLLLNLRMYLILMVIIILQIWKNKMTIVVMVVKLVLQMKEPSTNNVQTEGYTMMTFKYMLLEVSKTHLTTLNDQYLQMLNWKMVIRSICLHDMRAMATLEQQNTDPYDVTMDWMHPMFLGSKANSEDSPTW